MISKIGLTLIDRKTVDDNVKPFYEEAINYVLSFEWCDRVKDVWLAKNWDNLVLIFLISILPKEGSGADDEVWLVVGDIPPAYIEVESAPTKEGVVSCYVEIMEDWVDDVLSGGMAEDCYPLDVPPTKEHANMLKTRLDLMKDHLL